MPRNTKLASKPKNFKKTMVDLIKYLRPYYFRIILALVLVIGSTIIAIIGPKILGQATTLLFEGIVSKYQGGSGIDFSAILKILLTMLCLYVTSLLLGYVANWVVAGVSNRISYSLRRDISQKIDRLPLKFFDKQTHGEILSRVTNDVDNISQNLNSSIQQILTSIVTVVGVLWMMISISWKLTFMALIVVPLSGVAAAFIVKHSQKYFHRQQAYLGHVNGHIEEMYAGHLIVKTFNYEDKAIADFDKLNNELYESAHKSQFLSMVMQPIVGFIGNIGYVGVCLLGGFEVIAGNITIGNIQAFIQYVRQLNQPITQVAQIMNIIQSMAAAAERVFEILDEEEIEAEAKDPVKVYGDDGKCLIEGNVTFENVRFGYDPDNIIIKNFSMYVAPGKQVAIVGPTGAGKTTLVKLLMRFYELNGGAIYIDGHNIKDMRRSDLRSLFGMVLQDTWLYSGSIKDNIRYGKRDASDEEVYEAAKLAHVDHFVKTLENGYDTLVDEETSGISSGQKQLLTIARAFLKNPKILILDEATSSVDTRTEQLIQSGMEELMKGRTSFVIAHRLSTIKNSDLIIVLDKGDIVEVGNHQELLAKNGFYARLYNSQFEG